MASYQQAPDYQTYLTNPYQLPTQQIVQAIQTRNMYWDSAASMLKNSYQNYLNLSLLNPQNKEKLDGLMQGVQDQLKKASQTDLSLGENYGKALSIFDPIIKDQNIMGDHALANHYEQQMSVMNSLRLQNGGKQYSETNMRDLENAASDFARDNPNNWRQHYNNRQFATPYTDYSAELRQLDKDFKPDITQLTKPLYIDPTTGQPVKSGGVSSGYMISETDKSILASQYRAYLNSRLSENAKNQMALEGRVRYHDSNDALAYDYGNQLGQQINSKRMQAEELKGQIATAPAGVKDVYNDKLRQVEGDINDLTLSKTKLDAKDYSDLIPYKRQISGQVYTNQFLDYASQAAARKDISINYKQDDVWKNRFIQEQENNRFNIGKQFALEEGDRNRQAAMDRALIKAGLKGGASSLLGDALYDQAGPNNNESFGEDKLNELKQESAAKYQQASDNLESAIRASTPGFDSLSDAAKNSARNEFMNKPYNSAIVNSYKEAASLKDSDDEVFKAMDDYVNKKIQQQYPEAFNVRQRLANTITKPETVILSDELGRSHNITLSPDDLKKVILQTNPNVRLEQNDGNLVMGANGEFTPSGKGTMLNVNGKSYQFRNQTLQQIIPKIKQGEDDFADKRKQILNQDITKIVGIRPVIADEKNPVYRSISNVVTGRISGGDSGDIQDKDVRITDVDDQGNVYFTLQGDKVNQKAVMKKVQADGGNYIEGRDAYYLPSKFFGDLSGEKHYNDPRMENIARLVRFRSFGEKFSMFNTPSAKWGNRPFQFRVTAIDGHPSYQIYDPDSGAVFSKDDKGNPIATLESAASYASMLGNLDASTYVKLAQTVGGVR